MKRFFNCLRGECSTNAGEVYDDEPLGPNQYLDPNETLLPTSPPLPANCGRRYKWRDILDGTLNFRQTYLLGTGNFGVVYRCHFSTTNEDGAVKIQDRNNQYGHQEFLAEVKTLHAANHPNVIKLLGRCYGRRNRAIVYEFMPNGSLDRHLFFNWRQGLGPPGLQDPTRVLDWDTRMKIAVGVAQGLVYIHQVLKVINMDVKVENVLLDANFVPKLTDFGLSNKITVNEKGVEQLTQLSLMKGTQGCIAPESEHSQLISTKSDVYSYGVFLFVLFTGRRAFDRRRPVEKMKLTDWFKRVWTRMTPVDVALGNNYSVEGLNRIYHTAMMCIHGEACCRPTMTDVEAMVREAATFPVQVVPLVTRRHSLEYPPGFSRNML